MTGNQSGALRILLIDDDEAVRQTVGMMLSDAGYEVIEADNGKSGLREIESRSPDLVISDLIMPDMGGIEAIQEIRKMQPGLPVIAISGGGRTSNYEFLDIAEKLGANAILAKPFDPEEIVAAVERVRRQ